MRFRDVALPALALACLVSPPAVPAACDCSGAPFRAARAAKLGLESQTLRSVLVNEPGGKLKLGPRAFMPASTNLTADQVFAGAGASFGSVNANIIRFHSTATVAGPVVGPLAVPVVPPPLCTVSVATCGVETVVATATSGLVVLSPGAYDRIVVGKGGFMRLLPGTYDVCSLSVARAGALINEGPVTMNVVGSLRAATGALLLPATDQPRIVVNLAGSIASFGTATAVRAEVNAPAARVKIGRQSGFDGCVCSRDLKIGSQASAGCTDFGSPSGAFVE